MGAFALLIVGFVILAMGLGASESEKRDGTASGLIGFGGILMLLGGAALLSGI